MIEARIAYSDIPYDFGRDANGLFIGNWIIAKLKEQGIEFAGVEPATPFVYRHDCVNKELVVQQYKLEEFYSSGERGNRKWMK